MTICPFCNSDKKDIVTDKFRGNDGTGLIVKCKKCKIKYLFDRKTNQQIEKLYDRDSQLRDIVRKRFNWEEYIARISDDTERRLIFCKEYLNKRSFVIDIGCGYGYFIKRISDTGIKAIGIEPSRVRAEKARKKFNVMIINKYLEDISNKLIPHNSADIITIFHVLEHLSDPDKLIKECFRRLKKEGALIVEIPSSNDYLFFIPEYAKFVYQISHRIYFSKKHLIKLLQRNGFKNVKTINIQRYSLYNALHWVIKGKPQIEKPIHDLKGFLQIADMIYKKLLSFIGKTDTLIAIGYK